MKRGAVLLIAALGFQLCISAQASPLATSSPRSVRWATRELSLPATDEGVPQAVVQLEVFRLPEGTSWSDVEAYCASGVLSPGDIALVDQRSTTNSASTPCYSMRWLNGNPLTWSGNGCRRFRRLEICGVFAARNLMGSAKMPTNIVVDSLADAGWEDVACRVASDAWRQAWASNAHADMPHRAVLGAIMKRVSEPKRSAFHAALVEVALEQARQGERDGSRAARHRPSCMLVELAEHLPPGSRAADLVGCLRTTGLQGSDTYIAVIRELRLTLVAERAYGEAVLGDPDPVGAFLDEAFWAGAATAVASLVPASLLPVDGTKPTAAQMEALKDAAIELQREERRASGVALFEALIGVGRDKEAQRLRAELVSRFPTPPISSGETPEGRELRKIIGSALPQVPLDERLVQAEARARANAATGSPPTAPGPN